MFERIKNRAVIEPDKPVIYVGISKPGVTSGGIYKICIYSERGSPTVWVFELTHKTCLAILPFNQQDWTCLNL